MKANITENKTCFPDIPFVEKLLIDRDKEAAAVEERRREWDLKSSNYQPKKIENEENYLKGPSPYQF